MTIENQLTEEQRLAIIGRIVKAVQSGESTLSPKVQDFIDEVKGEQDIQEMVVKHGLLNAQAQDMEDERQFLGLVDDPIFVDEEEPDMEVISPEMREVAG